MQRLLIVIPHGDGYTYSAEETKPVVFSSKEELVITLEDLTTNYLKEVTEFNNKYAKLHDKFLKLREEFSTASERNKRSKPSEKIDNQLEIASEKYQEISSKMNDFIKQHEPKHFFEIGGQEFSFENFFYRDENDRKKTTVSIPEVYTLDEYFYAIENLPSLKKIKP